MLEIINVSKSFKKIQAVDSLSFKAYPGQILGLLGENGAGKTTTIRMVANLLKPTSGSIQVDQLDSQKDANQIRGKIGILFGGDVALYDRLSGRENMMYFASLNGLNNQEANKSINELIERFEMGEYIDRPVGKYSRGMKQKVSIARSIVHNPQIVLFDEPTTGLDVISSRLVHQFILDCKKEGRIVIFSSHNMYEVEKLSDYLVIMHKGKKITEGTIEDIKADHQMDNLEDVFVSIIGGESNE